MSIHTLLPTTEAPALIQSNSASTPSQSYLVKHLRVLLTSRCLLPLIGSFFCIVSLGVLLWFLVENRAQLTPISGFWGGVGLLLPFVGAVKFLVKFIENVEPVTSSSDADSAMICSVEVCINSETVLTIRSWWPMRMSRPDCERHGIRVAMNQSRTWIQENAGKVSRLNITEEAAVNLCRSHICDTWIEDGINTHCCSVCLDDLCSCKSSGCVSMRKCGHVFHESCLATWFAQSNRLQCPMCRTDMQSCVPESTMTSLIHTEEPSINVVSVSVDQGSISSASS